MTRGSTRSPPPPKQLRGRSPSVSARSTASTECGISGRLPAESTSTGASSSRNAGASTTRSQSEPTGSPEWTPRPAHDELKQYEFTDPERTEQYHKYLDRKTAEGNTPRTPESYNTARDILGQLREQGLKFEADIAEKLDLTAPDGHNIDTDGYLKTYLDADGNEWQVRTRQATPFGAREADLLGPDGQRFEMKSGGAPTGQRILDQLQKDETFLATREPVTWVVESRPKADVLARMRELHSDYPGLFKLLNADGRPFDFTKGAFDENAPGFDG